MLVSVAEDANTLPREAVPLQGDMSESDLERSVDRAIGRHGGRRGQLLLPAQRGKRRVSRPSATTTVCGWKGTANYFSLNVGGKHNPDAAWYYADPKDAAKQIKGRVAFWKGVKVAP
jgi:hypothetical protein